MKAPEWLDDLVTRVTRANAAIDVTRAEPGMLTLALGSRSVLFSEIGGSIVLSPSRAEGTTIASRMKARVEYLDVQPFAIESATLEAALASALAHLTE